jgi:quinoprotein glucose dehydrogenase
MKRWLFLPLAVAAVSLVALAVPPDAEKAAKATAADVGDAARRAQVEKGLTVTAWASEPALANPVAFAFDGKGACYVVETNRFNEGTPDTRSFMHWLDDDIGSRSVEDRLAMYAKHKYPAYEKFGETVRKVWDSKGKGVADTSTLFAGPFNKPADGVAAGVLARDGDVYLTCIPSLYKLKDTKGTGTADVTDVLSTGYGVRVQFVGHDLHGLRMGPDGKLYFSIGDRGFKVVTKEGTTLSNPDSGAVLRCLPDGSKLEIVHVGLRNPQELAFDELGNLFTYDNNSDSGDKARWVQIVEGGDSGWRCGYQYGTLMHHAGVPQGNRGPWNAEGIWHTETKDSKPPAYVVPPLLHFGNGPSGLTYYPGVGLSDRYKGHFFACDFTASASNSVIWSLAVKPKGASFEVTDLHPFVKNMVATDCEFGPDGNFYWLDWVGGWSKPQKGRIFKVTDAEAQKNPAVAEAKKLLAEGFAKKTPAELIALFDHPHREVRQEAQFELAKRPEAGELLTKSKPKSVLAKLHTIWCLDQFGMQGVAERYLNDGSADVRRNAVKVYGKATMIQANGNIQLVLAGKFESPELLLLLSDTDLGVRAAAIRAYAKFKHSPPGVNSNRNPAAQAADYAPIFTVLKDNDNQDAYLRQAAVEALITLSGPAPCELANAWKASKPASDHPAVRLGVVLALRKLQCPKLDEWLSDADPAVVAEAARAIYDQALPTPMPGLAKLAENPGQPDAVAYRALAANYRLGEAVNANRVAAVAARSSENEGIRTAALKMLEEWAKPKRLDPITGLTMNLGERSPGVPKQAVVGVLAKLFVGSDALRKQSAQLTAKLGIQEVGPLMLELIADVKQPVNTRVEALFALEAVKAKQLAEAAKLALASGEAKLRGAARVVNAKSNPTAALKELPALLKDDKATLVEKQMALAVMGTLKESADIDGALADALTGSLAGKLPIALKLDVMEAAQARSTTDKLKLHAPLREKLKEIDTADRAAVAKDPLARDRLASAGGDATVGRQIFLNNAAVYCQRCHKLDGNGGEVGPALNDIAKTKDRDYLLESIVNPNAKIAEGYQSVILNLADGRTLSGVLRGKDAKTVTLVTAENKTILVPRDEIDAEKPDKSAMPDDLHKKLSKRELRDVVEFLASLK